MVAIKYDQMALEKVSDFKFNSNMEWEDNKK